MSSCSESEEEGKVSRVSLWVRRIVQEGPERIEREFLRIQADDSEDRSCKAWADNPERNRYGDVKCLDETRVVLWGWETDYIHANYVRGLYSERVYILAQGPLPHTVPDFLHMLWQENTTLLIQLTKFIEDGVPKCAVYWPCSVGGRLEFGPYSIRTSGQGLMELEGENILHSQLLLERGGESRSLTHLYLDTWPDRESPELAFSMVALLNKVHKLHRAGARSAGIAFDESPIVIHCSAGVGRSGSLVALDLARQQLAANRHVRIREVVREVRAQREKAVQTESQFRFLFVALLQYAKRTFGADFTFHQPFL